MTFPRVFPAPADRPVQVDIDGLQTAYVTVTASARADVSVDVQPADPNNKRDVKAAENVSVHFNGAKLLLTDSSRTPKFQIGTSRPAAVLVDIAVPEGAQIEAKITAGKLEVTGPVAEAELKTAVAHIALSEALRAELKTASGNVDVGSVSQRLDVKTASGNITVNTAPGDTTLKTASGNIDVYDASNQLRAKTASGSLTIGTFAGIAGVKSASGRITLRALTSGEFHASAASGTVEVGIAEGTAAWLDLEAKSGRVTNLMEAGAPPVEGQPTAKVHARTASGDITVRRAA